MDIFEAIELRKSVRSYLNKPVEDEKLKKILEAARLSPSASNRQERRFVVVKNENTRQQLSIASKNQTFVAHAPVVIACCAQTDGHIMSCGQATYPIDLSIAIDHMTLAAAALQLGTCWIGAFSEEEVKQILCVPKEIRVVELLTLGYPSDPSKMPKHRLPLDELVKYEKW